MSGTPLAAIMVRGIGVAERQHIYLLAHVFELLFYAAR